MTQDGSLPDLPDPVRRALERTPARLLVGRTGPSYPTRVWLRLRADQAAARDAVLETIDLDADLGPLVGSAGLYEVTTLATDRPTFIAKPELGRKLSDQARATIAERTARGNALQVAVGDGLSCRAVATQVPKLLPLLAEGASREGWAWGTPFLLRQCRVGVMNDIGDVLQPKVLVLLIGERPGLATAESLSAYMAYEPRGGQTDADRNLISNIHSHGVPVEEAAGRIIRLARRMMALEHSGVAVKETAGEVLPHAHAARD